MSLQYINMCIFRYMCVFVSGSTFEYCLPVAAEREREVNPRVSRGAAGEVKH